ncbi:MAG: aldehyde dehydrogenase (NADP(+)) [Luteolibacter sp.]
MSFHGHSLIDGRRSAQGTPLFQAVSPLDSTTLPGFFATATATEVNEALEAAKDAFPAFRDADGETRALFLEAIADGIMDLGSTLIDRARLESGLPVPRLEGERGRTVNQLRMFAKIARENTWYDARIETAQPDRQPIPKPDLRRAMQPIGPVVVFGASNFPLAFSVAGGDTASALVTGNPVVVKAHEAHPGTSELVAEVIVAAAAKTNLPAGVFSLVHGNGRTVGPWLAKHPATKAIGFTGSLAAGRALFDAAASRPDPIPVFAEMGSLNPIVLLPGTLKSRPTETAALLATSATAGAGQFCTKPGIIVATEGEGLDAFRTALSSSFAAVPPTTMLHAGIADTYGKSSSKLAEHAALTIVGRSSTEADTTATQGGALMVETTAEKFLAHPELAHEVFGPFSTLVVAKSAQEVSDILGTLGGQLTASIFGDEAELGNAAPLVSQLSEIAGRVIINGVPTGVEVNTSMQHGGPWPASSDARFTSVGTAALERFIRPVSYQGAPQSLLPPALRDSNPLQIDRLVNGVHTRESIQ